MRNTGSEGFLAKRTPAPVVITKGVITTRSSSSNSVFRCSNSNKVITTTTPPTRITEVGSSNNPIGYYNMGVF